MGEKKYIEYLIDCNGCGTDIHSIEGRVFTGLNDARVYAESHGWVKEKNKWYCPTCMKVRTLRIKTA